MAQGGDWKQFFRAAGEGRIWEINYHLDHNVDPDYQHPEFFSSALCEASRNGQVEAVELLLKRGANPLVREHLSDHLPLEIALAEQQHEVVDVFLKTMDKATTSSVVKRIFLDTDDHSLVEAVTGKSHFVVWKDGSEEQARQIRERTKNHKLETAQAPLETEDLQIHIAVFDNRSRAINPVKQTHGFDRSTRIICARPCGNNEERYEILSKRQTPSWWPRLLSFEPLFEELLLSSIFPETKPRDIEF